MRMSKMLSEEIAKKLTSKASIEVEKAYKEYCKFVTDSYNKTVPTAVKTLFKKYPEYLQTSNNIRLIGFGFNHDSITCIGRVIRNTDYHANMPMTKEFAIEAVLLKNKHIDSQKQLDTLREKIAATLFALGSFTQIQKHLPEAVPFLPKSTSVELIVNFDTLREEIKAAS